MRIVPRAAKDEICGELGQSLKIRLRAPPVEGRANESLRKLLAEKLGVSRAQITILSGIVTRTKRVRIDGTSVSHVKKALLTRD